MKKSAKISGSNILLMSLCLALCCLLAACSGTGGVDMNAIELQDYQSENGYEMQFPADWQMTSEDEENTTFVSADGKLSCTVTLEMGGIEVYSLEETGDMLQDRLGEQLFSSYEKGAPELNDKTYHAVLKGETAEGLNLTADVNIYHIAEGIRYYMVFLGNTADYAVDKSLISGIMSRFKTTLEEDEMYQLMMERREKAAQEAMEEWEKEQQALEEEAQENGEGAPECE